MDIILNRGGVYYCKEVRLLVSKNRKETLRNKYVLVLQGGHFFKRVNKVNVVLGTSKRIDKKYSTDVIIESCDSDLPKDTKFNCSEIYLFRKEDIIKSKYICTLSPQKMREIDIALILGLCIGLD